MQVILFSMDQLYRFLYVDLSIQHSCLWLLSEKLQDVVAIRLNTSLSLGYGMFWVRVSVYFPIHKHGADNAFYSYISLTEWTSLYINILYVIYIYIIFTCYITYNIYLYILYGRDTDYYLFLYSQPEDQDCYKKNKIIFLKQQHNICQHLFIHKVMKVDLLQCSHQNQSQGAKSKPIYTLYLPHELPKKL